MSQEESAARAEEKETNRIEAFSDGVFAIAITLLALDLKVPTHLAPITAASLAEALAKEWPTYLIFLISFATILIMWVYHHRLFQLLKRAETKLLFANGFLLLLVTTVPFPTGLVGTYLRTPAASMACATYAGFFVLINLAYDLLWWTVARQQPAYRSRVRRPSLSLFFLLLGLPSYLIATIVAFWSPFASLGICCALWIVWAVTAPVQHIKPADAAL